MARTAEEERRYQELLRRKREAEAAQRLREAQNTSRPQSPTEEVEAGFSFTRMIGGGLQDTYNAVVDTTNWFGELQQDAFGAVSGGLQIDDDWNVRVVEGRGLLDARFSDDQLDTLGVSRDDMDERFKVDIVGESENVWESTGRTLVSFLVPYTGAAKAVQTTRAVSLTGRVGREVAAASLVSLTAMDATENNIANTLRDGFGLENDVIEALVTEEDDSLLEGRLKATIANLPLELVGAGAFELGAAGIKAIRNARRVKDEERAIISAVKEDLTVNVRQAAEDAAPTPSAASPASSADEVAEGTPVVPTAEEAGINPGDLLSKPVDEKTATVPVSQVKAREPRTLQELTDYIEEVVDAVPVAQVARLEKIANALIKNPHKALDELDIDPVKLDSSVLRDEKSILALQDSLAEVVRKVARKTGRAGDVVKNEQAVLTARVLANSPRAVTRLMEKTNRLPEHMLAARMIVGSNGHRLAQSAESAIKEVEAGTTGEAYKQFIEDMIQQGLLLGTLRGAASEIGRALQTQKVFLGVADGEIAERLTREAADGVDPFVARYEELFKDLATDSGRLRLLNRVREADGDLTELTKLIQSRQTGRLQWITNAFKETKGNLFSFGTSLYNLGSAGFMMGYNGVAHAVAAAGLGAGAMFRNSPDMAVAARKQLYKAYATFHAPVMATGKAFNASWKAFAKEGLEEVSVVADSLGFEQLAKSVQLNANAAGEGLERGWLKRDMRVGERAIYVSPEAVNKVVQKFGNWPVGKVGQMGLEWFIKTGGAGINTFGAGTRLALSTFISAPDTFAGTLSAQIGKSVRAVDIAAEEAADAGLTGKSFTDYLSARARDLEELVEDGTSADAFDDAAKDLMERAGNEYARKLNFADDLEFNFTRNAASMFENAGPIGSAIMPFPRTPLRVMETTLIDFTPLGVLKARVRDMLNSGDPEQVGEVMARLSMSTAMLYGAYELIQSQALVGNDGGWNNTARRVRDSYTLKIGDDYHEISRLDPLGTVLGFMADAHAAFETGADNREFQGDTAGYIGELGSDIFEAALWPTFKNIFNKAYLESFSTLMNVAEARTPEQASRSVDRFLAGTATRFVPGSGFQRQSEKFQDETVRASRGLVDGWLKASWGSDKLPPRLDNIFGRPLKYQSGERLIGWKGGPSVANEVDRELARLSFELQPMDRKQKGVELNQLQYNRLVSLRGHEVKIGGVTLEERIEAGMKHPDWERMTDPMRIEWVKDSIRPYTSLAKKALLEEDKDFRFQAFVLEQREALIFQGTGAREANEEALRFAEELGLTPTE